MVMYALDLYVGFPFNLKKIYNFGYMYYVFDETQIEYII